jgi:hypothetical protein
MMIGCPLGFVWHYASFLIPVKTLIVVPLASNGKRRGRRSSTFELGELEKLSAEYDPGRIIGHGKFCDPKEVVRLRLEGKNYAEIARELKFTKATAASAFSRWYLKASAMRLRDQVSQASIKTTCYADSEQ